MFPFSLSDYVTRQDCNMLLIVCNEKVWSIIKAYHVIVIAKAVTKCGIIVTNLGYGSHIELAK